MTEESRESDERQTDQKRSKGHASSRTGWGMGALLAIAVVAILVGSGIGYVGATMTAPPPKKQTLPTAVWTFQMVGAMAGRRGPDGLQHDTALEPNMTYQLGQPLEIIVWDADDGGTGAHTITSSSLGISFQYPHNGAVPVSGWTVTYFWFNATSPGTFRWNCMLPCDEAHGNSWDMTTGSDGGPTQIGFMGGFITITS